MRFHRGCILRGRIRVLAGLVEVGAVLALLVCGLPLSAQVQRVVHQAIDLRHPPPHIRIDVNSSYSAVTWPMNGILIESNVKIYECKQNILDYLIKAGRYDLDTLIANQTLHLSIDPRRRDPIEVASGGCREEVEIKFYLPTGFFLDSLNNWSNPDLMPVKPLQVNSPPIDTLPASNGNQR